MEGKFLILSGFREQIIRKFIVPFPPEVISRPSSMTSGYTPGATIQRILSADPCLLSRMFELYASFCYFANTTLTIVELVPARLSWNKLHSTLT